LIAFPVAISEQRKIFGQLRDLLAETQRLESIDQQKLTALTELKQSILHKAFTGELTADSKALDNALAEASL
jgi:type I restriction enzyme S subunit